MQQACRGGAEAPAALRQRGSAGTRLRRSAPACSSSPAQPLQPSTGVRARSMAHGRQPSARCRLASLRAAFDAAEPDDAAAASNEELLARLRAAGVEALAATPLDEPHHPRNLSLAFLCWLSDREAEAVGMDKVELGALAAAVIALREGLRPLAAADYAAMAAGLGIEGADGGNAAAATGALEVLPSAPPSGLTDDELAQIARRRAALALSPAGAALAAQQVSQLKEGLGQSRVRSALELLGRAPVPDGEAGEAGINAAAATDRILDFLLEIEDAGERAALLPDAFTPPGPDAPASDDELQLSTRPLLLLNAVDARISMLQTAFDARLDLADDKAGDAAVQEYKTSQRRLAELREDVARFCEF